MKVLVTFKIEADDPEDYTGVTNRTYEEVTYAIMEVGGEDIDFRLVEE